MIIHFFHSFIIHEPLIAWQGIHQYHENSVPSVSRVKTFPLPFSTSSCTEYKLKFILLSSAMAIKFAELNLVASRLVCGCDVDYKAEKSGESKVLEKYAPAGVAYRSQYIRLCTSAHTWLRIRHCLSLRPRLLCHTFLCAKNRIKHNNKFY
jgi:hypothetical protein